MNAVTAKGAYSFELLKIILFIISEFTYKVDICNTVHIFYGHWRFPFRYVKYKCFMLAACVYSSLQLSISADTIHTTSHFKPLSEHKT